MMKNLGKLKFKLFLLSFVLKSKLKGKRDYSKVAEVINNYYKEDFKKVPVSERAVMLPHCIIHKKCPGRFSKEDGIICIGCGQCRCTEIKKLSEEKGYQFYISPSVGFTKRLTQRKNIRAAIGAACMYELQKGIQSEKINSKGFNIKKQKVIPHVILIQKYDCVENDVNWDDIKKAIREC